MGEETPLKKNLTFSFLDKAQGIIMIKVKNSGGFIYKYFEDFFIWNIVNIVNI